MSVVSAFGRSRQEDQECRQYDETISRKEKKNIIGDMVFFNIHISFIC